MVDKRTAQNRRYAERRQMPHEQATPPPGLPERRAGQDRRHGLRRATDRLQEELLTVLEGLVRDAPGVPRRRVLNQAVTHIGAYLAKEFRVSDDEVGILLLTEGGSLLRFVYPRELSLDKLSFFPVTAPSVAARVLRARRGHVYNRAPEVPHLHVYERIPLRTRFPRPIQKMIAVPLFLDEDRVLGVLEVSRKAESPEEAGPDFTEAEVLKLTDFGRLLASHLERILPEDL